MNSVSKAVATRRTSCVLPGGEGFATDFDRHRARSPNEVALPSGIYTGTIVGVNLYERKDPGNTRSVSFLIRLNDSDVCVRSVIHLMSDLQHGELFEEMAKVRHICGADQKNPEIDLRKAVGQKVTIDVTPIKNKATPPWLYKTEIL